MVLGTIATAAAPALIGWGAQHLFGGNGNGGQLHREPAMTEQQQQMMDQLIRAMSGQVGAGPPPAQQEGMGHIQQLLGQVPTGPSPYLEQAAGMLEGVGQPATRIDPEATEQFYQQTVREPMMRELQEDILPQIGEQFAGAGTYWGGARAGAQQQATQDMAHALAQQRARLGYQDEQARRQMAEQAMARQMQAAGQLAGIGGTAHQQRMGGLGMRGDLAQTLFGMGQPQVSPAEQMAMQLLQVQPEHVYFEQPQPGAMSQLLGLAGQLGAGWLAGQG